MRSKLYRKASAASQRRSDGRENRETGYHMQKELICWEENGIKCWEVVESSDRSGLLMNLLKKSWVDRHKIFIVPLNMVSGIWLCPDTHKSQRVDFWDFYKDYGTEYKAPELDETSKKVIEELKDQRGDDTKYGYVSPDGRYFHCIYQGHSALADRICYGLVETNNSERYLEEHGWCKIYKPLDRKQYSVYVRAPFCITDAQAKTLIKMGLEDAEDFADMLTADR